MNNANRSYQMMSWNVRGFNNPSRQEEVKQVVSTFKPDVIGVLIILLDKKRLNISTFKPDVICLQETKLSEISNSNVRNILGP
jgi:exonuclease III